MKLLPSKPAQLQKELGRGKKKTPDEQASTPDLHAAKEAALRQQPRHIASAVQGGNSRTRRVNCAGEVPLGNNSRPTGEAASGKVDSILGRVRTGPGRGGWIANFKRTARRRKEKGLTGHKDGTCHSIPNENPLETSHPQTSSLEPRTAKKKKKGTADMGDVLMMRKNVPRSGRRGGRNKR